MRRLMVLLVLAAMTLPAGAAKRVTVAQLEQALTAAAAAHKPDAEMARLIGGMELSERLSEARLGRLSEHLNAGSRAALALKLLADLSAFLDPPASELPSTAAPDEAAQQRMLVAARNYVAQSLPRLPNFLATRTTHRFDDSPLEVQKGSWPVRAGLHLVGTSSRETSVREERDHQLAAEGAAVWKEQAGLTTQGEFGSTLSMILADTAKGALSWSHWEEMATGLAAVFHYSVPRSASHYEVIGFPQRQTTLERVGAAGPGNRSIPAIALQPGVSPEDAAPVRARPGYHGSIWLDPATGTILRITIEAELKRGDPFLRAAILVEYGAVEISDKKFISPVRSLALSVAATDAQGVPGDAPAEWLNETLFTGYHRFAATTRILTGPPPE